MESVSYFERPLRFVEDKLQTKKLAPVSKYIIQRTGVSHRSIAKSSIGTGLLILLVCTLLFPGYICNTFGTIYPAYKSIQSMMGSNSQFQTDKAVNPIENQKWLVYWVVYSLLMYLEMVMGWLLFWIPFYHIFKLIFLIWMLLPRYRGSDVVFANLIIPRIQKYLPLIEVELKHISPSELLSSTLTNFTSHPDTNTYSNDPEEEKSQICSGEQSMEQSGDSTVMLTPQKLSSLITSIPSVPSLTRQIIRSSSTIQK